MEALTPASADDLPPLGELVADDLFWRYPAGGLAGEGATRLRVWLTARREAGYLAVVTKTGTAAPVTESAGRIRALLAPRYGPSVVLLEHYPAPEFSEGAETLDLVRAGADGSPHWTRIWPTPEDNPRHAGLERWIGVIAPITSFACCPLTLPSGSLGHVSTQEGVRQWPVPSPAPSLCFEAQEKRRRQ